MTHKPNNKPTCAQANCLIPALAILATAALAVLKITGVAAIPWWIVIAPFVAYYVIMLTAFIAVLGILIEFEAGDRRG